MQRFGFEPRVRMSGCREVGVTLSSASLLSVTCQHVAHYWEIRLVIKQPRSTSNDSRLTADRAFGCPPFHSILLFWRSPLIPPFCNFLAIEHSDTGKAACVCAVLYFLTVARIVTLCLRECLGLGNLLHGLKFRLAHRRPQRDRDAHFRSSARSRKGRARPLSLTTALPRRPVWPSRLDHVHRAR